MVDGIRGIRWMNWYILKICMEKNWPEHFTDLMFLRGACDFRTLFYLHPQYKHFASDMLGPGKPRFHRPSIWLFREWSKWRWIFGINIHETNFRNGDSSRSYDVIRRFLDRDGGPQPWGFCCITDCCEDKNRKSCVCFGRSFIRLDADSFSQ